MAKRSDPALLPFRRERLVAVATLLLAAPVPLVFAGALEPAVFLLYAASLGGLLVAFRRGRIPCLPDWALNVAGVLYVALFWLDVRFGSRSLLRTALHILLFTAVTKLASVRRERDLAVSLVLATFLLVASMATSFHSAILFFLVAFAALAWPLMARWSLWRDLAAAPDEWYRDERARQIPPGRSVALSLAAAFVLSVPFFVVLPRLKTSFTPGRSDGGEVWTGFSETVDSSLYGRLKRSDKVFVRIAIEEGEATENPPFLRLRLVAFSRYESGAWQKPARDGRILGVREGMAVPLVSPDRAIKPPAYRLSVELAPLSSRFLPYPTTARSLTLSGELFRRVGAAPVLRDGLGNLRLPFEPDRQIRYEVESGAAPFVDMRAPVPGDETLRALGSRRLAAFGRDAAGGADPARDPFLFARRLEAYLSTRFLYTLELPRSGPNPVEEFLFERRAGNCESFASAMALVLRENGVASRLVTGFAGGELGPFGSYFLVRGRDAHAWVEAWCGPARGWVPFDPTPPDGQPGLEKVSLARRLGQLFDNLEFLYGRYVLSFGQSDQVTLATLIRDTFVGLAETSQRLAVAVKTLARQAAGTARGLALVASVLLALATATMAAVRLARATRGFGTRGLPVAAAAYRRLQRHLRRRGAPLTPASAPAETLDAAAAYGSRAAGPARRLVRAYLAESFGGRPLREEERRTLREDLRQLREATRPQARG